MRYIGTFTDTRLVVGVASGPGQKQKNSTDGYAAFETRAITLDNAAGENIPVAVVASGVGDQQQKASQLAAEAISATLGSYPQWPIQQLLVEALQRANRILYQEVATDPQLTGMGATAIAAAILPDTLYLAYVGDCRAYLIRNGAIHLLTVALPPSPVTALATRQAPASWRAPLPPPLHIHFFGAAHVLGRAEFVEVATAIVPPMYQPQNSHAKLPTLLTSHLVLEAHDTILLCTPGLPREVIRQEVASILQRYSLQEAAWQLAVQANQAGATRSYTVLLMQQKPRRAPIVPPLHKRPALRAGFLATVCLLLIVIGWPFLTEQGGHLVRLGGAPTPLVAVAPLVQESSSPTPELARVQSVTALPATEPPPTPPTETAVVPTPTALLAEPPAVAVASASLAATDLRPVAVAASQIYSRLALTATLTTFQQNMADTLETVGALVAAAHTATTVAVLPTPTLPSPTLTATATSTAISTSTATATATAAATAIPTATPTRIPPRSPSATRRPTLTPSPISTVQANRVASRKDFADATVVLLEPNEKDTLNSKRPFRWEANFALPPGYAFEVVFWQRGQDPLRQGKGYAGISEQTQVNASYDNFHQREAPEGEYRWGVLLVIKEPYQRIKYLGGDRVIYVRSN